MPIHFLAPETFLPVIAQAAPAPVSTQQLLDQLHRNPPNLLAVILWFFIGLLVSVLSLWAASGVVAGGAASLGNAFKVWILNILADIGVVFVGAVLIVVLVAAKSNGLLILALVFGFFLLFLIAVVSIPMKIYEIGILRSIGFLILAAFFSFVANIGLIFVPGNPAHRNMPILMAAGRSFATQRTDDQKKALQDFFKNLAAGKPPFGATQELLPGEQVAGDPSKSLNERSQGLKAMYDELGRQQTTLKTSDPDGIARYKGEEVRYTRLLSQLKADADAAAAAQAPVRR